VYNFVVSVPVKRDSRFEYLGGYSKSRSSLAMDPIVQLLSVGYKSSTSYLHIHEQSFR
jgi:hypothetical protein